MIVYLSLISVVVSDTRHLELSKLPALRLLDVSVQPSRPHYDSLISALLNPPGHSRLNIVTIRIDIQIYAEEYSYSFDQYGKDAAAIVALHKIPRVDVHYNTNHFKKETMRSFFATDFV
jgi:hypothetical protein